jgi:hypothetical protein
MASHEDHSITVADADHVLGHDKGERDVMADKRLHSWSAAAPAND